MREIISKVKDSHATQGKASDSPAPSIESTIFELQASTKLLSEVLNDFTAALDTIDNLPEEQEAQTEQYIDTSVDLIDEAQRLAMELEKA
ncbi:unnamed protein product [Heligmosomoides polygyrus]|uniref:Uncharacterized protein n=1 Tax=Heligmosomoides polygyrus TaxID=6339 RepID=A0A3P8I7Y8_HELPZ|nr:unnamed protein product [Heligmosomoides polygyrus]